MVNVQYPLGIATILYLVFILCGCDRVTWKRDEDLRILALKSKCREDGEKVRSEWKRTYHQDIFSDEPGYGYNQSLKTCLWIDEYRGPAIDTEPAVGRIVPKLVLVQTHVKFILDIYTNKTLIEYTEHDGKQVGEVSETYFKRQKAQLFGSQP